MTNCCSKVQVLCAEALCSTLPRELVSGIIFGYVREWEQGDEVIAIDEKGQYYPCHISLVAGEVITVSYYRYTLDYNCAIDLKEGKVIRSSNSPVDYRSIIGDKYPVYERNNLPSFLRAAHSRALLGMDYKWCVGDSVLILDASARPFAARVSSVTGFRVTIIHDNRVVVINTSERTLQEDNSILKLLKPDIVPILYGYDEIDLISLAKNLRWRRGYS